MSDTAEKLWQIREESGLSREKVSRLLEPPISAKTLERWERGLSPIKHWRLRQLASIYGVKLGSLNGKAAA